MSTTQPSPATARAAVPSGADKPSGTRSREPVSTYRVQINARRPLGAAAESIGYLHRLGADWVYLSPLLQSAEGSDHGYDVVDHHRTDEVRGGAKGLATLADAAHANGMGVLADIVPNHVGVAVPRESVWWWQLLREGRSSPYASYFDVDWAAGDGKLRIPVLGGEPETEAAELDRLELRDGVLAYYDNEYPIAPGTESGTPQQVHDRQHYRLVNWQRADAELNYRRFFAVNSLAAITVERPEVFTDSHAEIARWIGAGAVDGLRVDHPDGLADPGGYLQSLAALTDGRYVLVEKILEPGEQLPDRWACAGTTGYDALAVLDRLLTDPAGQPALDALDTTLRGAPAVWPDLVHQAKREVADGILHSEVLRLARLVLQIDRADDAIAELLTCFPVYRSYLPQYGAGYLAEAVDTAVARRPDLAEVLVLLHRRLLETDTELSRRFQQTSGMVMAKGVEDCAFYRWPRLVSLTEVGADPSIFALSPSEFHHTQQQRLADWPHSMVNQSTHDTKRGEDVRARVAVLSEISDEWALAVPRWLQLAPLSDGPLANLLLQTAIGAWPIERDRLQEYAVKAAREAQVSTSWTAVNEAFEAQMSAFVDALYDHPQLHREFTELAARLTPPGWSNSLSAKLITLAGVGVPDVYQGTEIWENSLVDPDNRRSVDLDGLDRQLADLDRRAASGLTPDIDASGDAKLLVTSRALRLRRDRPDLFTGYRPLTASGPAAEHLIGFDRGTAIVLATRLPVGLRARGGWADTTVELPGTAGGPWRDALTGNSFAPGTTQVSTVLGRLPVALLVPSE